MGEKYVPFSTPPKEIKGPDPVTAVTVGVGFLGYKLIGSAINGIGSMFSGGSEEYGAGSTGDSGGSSPGSGGAEHGSGEAAYYQQFGGIQDGDFD